MSNFSPPVRSMNYPTYLWQYVIDKTGTIFQTLAGNVGPNTPWGVRVWRCPPNGKPELVYFLENGNGTLCVDHQQKRLLFLATDANRSPFITVIDGYIYPSDCPDQTIVNVNEVQVATLKQSIATTQQIANSANANANSAKSIAEDANNKVAALTKTVNSLQAQVNSLQTQVNSLLTPSQVADLVWQKLKDMNFLYRLAFLAWPKNDPDPDIQAYVNDLVTLIKKAK